MEYNVKHCALLFPVQWENSSDFETGSIDSRGAIHSRKSSIDAWQSTTFSLLESMATTQRNLGKVENGSKELQEIWLRTGIHAKQEPFATVQAVKCHFWAPESCLYRA